jgi:transcriptional regulator with XRE-family HTH domain
VEPDFRADRLARKMSQSDLAESIGVSKQAISQYELGHHFPSLSILDQMGSVLGRDYSSYEERCTKWKGKLSLTHIESSERSSVVSL